MNKISQLFIKSICPFFQAITILTWHFFARLSWNYHQYLSANLESKKQKYILLGLSFLSICCFLWFEQFVVSFIVLLATVDIFSTLIINRPLKWFLCVLMIIRFKPPRFTLNNIEENLQELGINNEKIKKIIFLASQSDEILLAEWGKANKIWSYFGKIPGLGAVDEDIQNFQSRGIRHNQLQLVVLKKQLAIKKHFYSYRVFFNEVFSLIKLQDIGNTPVLFNVSLMQRTLYRPLIHAKNLGLVLEKSGLDLHKQRKLDALPILKNYQFKQSLEHPNRLFAINILNKLFDDNLRKNLHNILTEIHHHNMSYGDIWYSNILLLEHKNIPYLSDFDSTNWYPFNNDSFRLARIKDWKKFNLLFNDNVPIPETLDSFFAAYTAQFPEVRNEKRVLFSNGCTLGTGCFFDSPTWLWPFIVAKISKISTTFIHLGVQTGSMAMHSLRLGAKKCVILENRISHHACAELLLNAHQILDNRCYAAEFYQHYAYDTINWDWQKGEIVCSFSGLNNFKEQEIIAALSGIPNTVACIILEGKAINYCDVLKKRNFKVEPELQFPFSKRHFIFAYPIAH